MASEPEPDLPKSRLTWLYHLPWIAALGWGAYSAVRVVVQSGRFSPPEVLGSLVGGALAAFAVMAIGCMILAAALFALLPFYSMAKQVMARLLK